MYITDAETTTYFTGTSKSTLWSAIAEPTRLELLSDASVYIDKAFSFTGTQSDEIQAFPRVDCYNQCTKTYYDNTVIPQIIKNATAEIALRMSSDSGLSTSSLNTDSYNIKREKVGSLEVEYKEDSSQAKESQPYGYTFLKCILNNSKSGFASSRLTKG